MDAKQKQSKKSAPESDSDAVNNGGGSIFFLCMFLLLEAAAFASVTVWQEHSLQTLTSKLATGDLLLSELEDTCTRQGRYRREDSQTVQTEKDGLGRERRASLADLFRELMNTQEQVLISVCQQHPDLCRFGPNGDVGDIGNRGPAGSGGPKGEPGSRGAGGEKGQPGPDGVSGPVGQPGPRGTVGSNGTQGGEGAPGEVGPAGQAGSAGAAGHNGTAGPRGDTGATGPQGPKGAPGKAGVAGAKGERGDAGLQGPPGDLGTAGPKGSALGGDCLCVEVPTISGNFSDVEHVRLHQSVTLHCDISDPNANVTWRSRNANLMQAGNVRSSGNDLILTSVTQANEGVYECVAISDFGEVTKDVEIKLVAPSTYDCDFEQDFCSWTNEASDKFDWTRLKGPTPSAGTGPTKDHTLGTSDGFYAYIESSGARVNGDNARLESLIMNPSQEYCLTFWYHLFGNSIGSVDVRINKNGQTGNPLWSQTGPPADQWKQGVIDIPPQSTPFHLVIEGVRGNSYNGDAAIDDIAVSESPCP